MQRDEWRYSSCAKEESIQYIRSGEHFEGPDISSAPSASSSRCHARFVTLAIVPNRTRTEIISWRIMLYHIISYNSYHIISYHTTGTAFMSVNVIDTSNVVFLVFLFIFTAISGLVFVSMCAQVFVSTRRIVNFVCF